MSSPASISALLVRPLAAALAGDEGALGAFFGAADLTPEMLADGDARLSPAQFCVAWAEAIRLAGDPTLALTIAEATPAGAFGVVEYVCRSAPTLREALRQWVRYLGILDDAVEVALVEHGDRASLRVVVESEAPAPASHELCFALVTRHARALVPAFEPAAVRFIHAAPRGKQDRYRAFFGCEVSFAAKYTELVVTKASLDAPLATADASLLAILLPTAEEHARAARTAEPSLTGQIRRALRAALSNDDAQLETVAKQLGLTGRSLQRRLREEGTSFQTLRDETRRALADRYLGEGLSIAEVSFLLGFSEPSAFFRAFKRWTGLTPIEHRAQQRAAV